MPIPFNATDSIPYEPLNAPRRVWVRPLTHEADTVGRN